MSNSDNSPATKKDLKELEAKMEANIEASIEASIGAKLADMEARLVELIRDSQTEMLRGFEKSALTTTNAL